MSHCGRFAKQWKNTAVSHTIFLDSVSVMKYVGNHISGSTLVFSWERHVWGKLHECHHWWRGCFTVKRILGKGAGCETLEPAACDSCGQGSHPEVHKALQDALIWLVAVFFKSLKDSKTYTMTCNQREVTMKIFWTAWGLPGYFSRALKTAVRLNEELVLQVPCTARQVSPVCWGLYGDKRCLAVWYL